MFVGFCPAASDDACKAMRQEIRRWRLHLRSGSSLTDLARQYNVIVQGWINYYGRCYPSWLSRSLHHINYYLVRWSLRKYKRLRGHIARAWRFLAGVAQRDPNLFAHWRWGIRPTAG